MTDYFTFRIRGFFKTIGEGKKDNERGKEMRDRLICESPLTSNFIVVYVWCRAAAKWHVECRELCQSGSSALSFIPHPCHLSEL